MPKKIIFVLLLISIIVFAIFFFGEIILRLFGYHGEASLRISNTYQVDDSVLNYRYKPGSVYSVGKVRYLFNRNGLRDYDIPLKKGANVYRILMLGDSVAEGYGVNLENTVGKQLEDLLNNSNKTKKFEVINIAMGGLNTFQEAHLLGILGTKYTPDLVILNYVLNDADGGMHFKSKTKEEKYTKINLLNISVPSWLKETLKRSALILFIKNRIDALIWRFDINDSDDPFDSIKTDYFHKIYKNDKNWDKVLEGFAKIDKKAKESNCNVIMIVFPVMYDFENYDWVDIHTKVKEAGKDHGFLVLDLFDEYVKYPLKSIRLERGDFVHPNKKGHKIAADVLFHYITKAISKGK
ncbi:MAG: SGNH/GDSL hydrolase family protein [Planctomycetota bacterium]